MSFADPQSITIAAATSPLPRVSVGKFESSYQSADGLIIAQISHSYGRRNRHVMRLDHSKQTTDPIVPANNLKVSASVYLVVDAPVYGYTNVQLKDIYTGFKTQFLPAGDAPFDKLVGGES